MTAESIISDEATANDAAVNDSLTSLTKNIGTQRDGVATLQFERQYLDVSQLIAMYECNWIARKIVDTHPFDATRKFREWQGKDAPTIARAEKRFKVPFKVRSGMTKANLFGGAAAYIGLKDAVPSEPLDVEKVKKGDLQYVTVLTQHELEAGEIDRDVFSEFYGSPRHYKVSNSHNTVYGQYGTEGEPGFRRHEKSMEGSRVTELLGDVTIHPSRLAIFKGDMPADDGCVSFVPRSNYGGLDNSAWGVSRLQAPYETIKQTSGSFAGIASLMLESNVDVIAIPNLAGKIKKDEVALLKRFSIAAMCKGINGMLILDQDEKFYNRTASFANINSVLEAFLLVCSAAASIPATHFLGQSPGGLQATGESDERTHFDRVEAIQTTEIEPALATLDQCMVRSELGTYPDDLTFEWCQLKQETNRERAETSKLRGEVIGLMMDAGMPTPAIYEMVQNWGLLDNTDINDLRAFEEAIATPDPEEMI